jgi:hypothetical protein
MSDYMLKIIPTDCRYVPARETHEPARELLEELLDAETDVRVYENLQYIDAGEALETIVCPRCISVLSLYKEPAIMDWYDQIAEEEAEKGSVESLNVITPCCNANVPFEELEFKEGGFALFELAVTDPDLPDRELPPSSIAELEKALGCALKQVWAHY